MKGSTAGQVSTGPVTARCPSRTGVHLTPCGQLEAAAFCIPTHQSPALGQMKVSLSPLCLRGSSRAWIRGRCLHCRCVVGSDAPSVLVKCSLALLWGTLPDLPHSRTLTANGSISFPTFSFLALAQTSSISTEHHFQSFLLSVLTPQTGLWDGGQPHPTEGQAARTIPVL